MGRQRSLDDPKVRKPADTDVCGTVVIMESLGVDVECSVGTIEKSICNAGIGLFNGTSSKVHPGALPRNKDRIMLRVSLRQQ